MRQMSTKLMGKSLDWWFRTGFYAAVHPALFLKRPSYNAERFLVDHVFSRRYNYPYRIMFIAGMAMSATTWVKNLLARVPGYYTRSTPMPYDIAYNADICDSAFSHVPKRGYTLFKTHLNPTRDNYECIFRNGVERVIVTYRDLRDVALSRYHRLVDFPKPIDAFDFVDYRAMGKEKALDHSIDVIVAEYVSWIRGWFEIAKQNPERFHFVKFEEMKKDVKKEFQRMLHFYGIELSGKKVDAIIEAARGRGDVKENIIASPALPWGYSSNFRSGKVGSWKGEMSNAHIQKCKILLGDALIELGYEKDVDWEKRASDEQ